MTSQEANKIIAEFMGVKVEDDCPYTEAMHGGEMTKVYGSPYFSSLDALVPVWEKLNLDGGWVYDSCGGKESWIITFTGKEESGEWCPTIQEAAAIATAKAIQEMGK
jgi:hypothetical protein